MELNPTERYTPVQFVRTVNSPGCASCKAAHWKRVSRTRCYSAGSTEGTLQTGMFVRAKKEQQVGNQPVVTKSRKKGGA